MKSPTPNAQPVALATIGVVSGDKDQVAEPITVHFNPVSLQLQVSNELKDTGNAQRKQYIAKTTTKLTMDLVFDTTDTGEDVTLTTRKLQAFLAPESPPGQTAPRETPPPVVLFDWGTLRFKGVAENYKETIDFFSANGVPLRASINLTLSRQDAVFDKPSDNAPKNAGGVDDNLFDAPGGSASDLANTAGVPSAARALAAANGQASLRFAAGGGLTVGASIELKPPVAFASAGAGIGIEASAGIGVSVGAGVGIGGSVSAGAGVSASAGIAGLAGLSATEGAFAGLRTATSSSGSVRIDSSRLAPKIASTTVATDAGATFQVGGKASFQGAAGLRADVGPGARLSFDSQ
jgi:hypothetical protein